MKRLLLPLLAAIALPTAVNAFPWSSDIVVKTDLGVKFVVKESAVNVIPMGDNQGQVLYLKFDNTQKKLLDKPQI